VCWLKHAACGCGWEHWLDGMGRHELEGASDVLGVLLLLLLLLIDLVDNPVLGSGGDGLAVCG